MPDEGTFYAPLGYAALWPWVAAALVAGTLIALAWALWPTRKPATHAPTPRRAVDVERARREALDEIERICAEAAAGSISIRRAHLALSAVVRGFADEVSAVPAMRMTLEELAAAAPAPITSAVARLYPGEFGPHGGELDAAVAAAREAVTS